MSRSDAARHADAAARVQDNFARTADFGRGRGYAWRADAEGFDSSALPSRVTSIHRQTVSVSTTAARPAPTATRSNGKAAPTGECAPKTLRRKAPVAAQPVIVEQKAPVVVTVESVPDNTAELDAARVLLLTTLRARQAVLEREEAARQAIEAERARAEAERVRRDAEVARLREERERLEREEAVRREIERADRRRKGEEARQAEVARKVAEERERLAKPASRAAVTGLAQAFGSKQNRDGSGSKGAGKKRTFNVLDHLRANVGKALTLASRRPRLVPASRRRRSTDRSEYVDHPLEATAMLPGSAIRTGRRASTSSSGKRRPRPKRPSSLASLGSVLRRSLAYTATDVEFATPGRRSSACSNSLAIGPATSRMK